MTIGSDLDAELQNLQTQVSAEVSQAASVNAGAMYFTGFDNLKIACRPGVNTYEISFDRCILEDANGNPVRHGKTSLTLDPTAAGLNGLDTGALSAANNGWYEIHVISNGTAPQAIMTLAGGTICLPSGYAFHEFAGYAQVFAVSPLSLSQSLQQDNIVVMQDRGALASTGVAASAANTAQTLDISPYVPPKTRFVSGMMGGAPNCRMMMAVMTWATNRGIPSDIGRRNANGPA